MRRYVLIAATLPLLAACSGPRKSGYDEFEKVKVDRMVGNGAGNGIISRTVVCLNAMREERWLPATTNITITLATNYVVTTVTNQTVTRSENEQQAANTNATVSPGVVGAPKEADGTAPIAPVVMSPLADSTSGGTTRSGTRSESIATGPNQMVISRNHQTVTQVADQSTVNTNGQSLTASGGRTITVETNWVITTLTNQVVSPVTNVVVRSPERTTHDYYLYTEIAPADLQLAAGENLVLLVDGRRYAFAPAVPVSGWNSRRGYLTTHYRVPPQVIEAIANAQEVNLRIRGQSASIERTLPAGSRRNFREFLLRHFGATAGREDKFENPS